MWVVFYARITTDKEKGVTLQSVNFGAIESTEDNANTAASNCTAAVKNACAIVKIFKIKHDFTFFDAMYEAIERFESMIISMRDTEITLNKNKK